MCGGLVYAIFGWLGSVHPGIAGRQPVRETGIEATGLGPSVPE